MTDEETLYFEGDATAVEFGHHEDSIIAAIDIPELDEAVEADPDVVEELREVFLDSTFVWEVTIEDV
jgi:hypothetical protein